MSVAFLWAFFNLPTGLRPVVLVCVGRIVGIPYLLDGRAFVKQVLCVQNLMLFARVYWFSKR